MKGSPAAALISELRHPGVRYPEPRTQDLRRPDVAVRHLEDPGETILPRLVGGRHVLPGVRFDPGHRGNVGGDAYGVDERRARTGEVLHAEEHPVLLRGGGHQHGLALALARLERDAVVAHLAREQEALEVRER